MSYTAFGEVDSVVNGNEEDTYYTYDSLGRVDLRVTNEGYEQYFYDAPPAHPDVPDAVEKSTGTQGLLVGISRDVGHSEWTVRDEFDRVVDDFDVFGGETYQQSYQFDGYGRIERATFPSLNGKGVRQHFQYDALGNVESVDVSAGSTYITVWEAQARDASGRIVLEKKGDVTFDRVYDDLGRLERQIAYGAKETIQDYGWGYTARSEVDYRESFLTGEVEDFGYDEVGRLISVDPSSDIPQAWDYDAFVAVNSSCQSCRWQDRRT